MKKQYITQGEDVNIQFPVKDINGLPLDLSGYADLRVIIHDGYGNVLAKFMPAPADTGWYELSIDGDPANGVVEVHLLTEVTSVMIPGNIYAEVLIKYFSSAPDDSTYDICESGVYLFTVKESQIIKQSLI